MHEVGRDVWLSYIEWYGNFIESYSIRTDRDVDYYENDKGTIIGTVANDGSERLYFVNPNNYFIEYIKN